jgi:transposase InsO family protein
VSRPQGSGRPHGRAGIPVGVGTRFAHDGEVVTIVELFAAGQGNQVLVEDRGGKRRYWLSLRELLTSGTTSIIDHDGGPRSDDDIDTAGAILATLTSRQLAKVSETASHVREVLTGFKSGTAELAGPGEPHAPYRPDVPMLARYQAKADELRVDRRTVQRWTSAYQEHGEAGLASAAQSDPMGQTDPRWVAAVTEIMVENGQRSRPNRKSVVQQARARLAIQYGDGVVPLPSKTTAYRRLTEIDRLIPTFHGSRERNRDVASRVDDVYGKLIATRPGEYMVMDTNSLDVFAMDPITLKWASVELTVAMDAYTRCITGLRVAPTTKSLEVAATLFQAFRPLPAPADWPEHAVWPEHGIPRVVFPDVDALHARQGGACNPAIVPETIIVDHGAPYKNQHLSSVCQRMGISIQPARVRTATDKGMIERFFLSLRLDLLQHLPGYKGPDVYSRGVDIEADAFLYIDELEALIRKWIAVVYHHRPHDSLFDPSLPAFKLTPAQMFQHGIERAGYIEAPRDPHLAFEFLKPVRRQVHHYGVEYNSRRYNGPGLNGFRGHQSPYGGDAKRRWFIYVNPDDVNRVYFRHPTARTWHTLLWEHSPALDLPMSEHAVRFARRLAKARGSSTDPEAALEVMLDQANMGLGKTAAERKMSLRLARERATLLGDLTTDDLPDVQAFLAAHRSAASRPSEAEPSQSASSEAHDDLDDFADDDDELDDDRYYADAFEAR